MTSVEHSATGSRPANERLAPLDPSGLLRAEVSELDGAAELVLRGELDAASAPALRRLIGRLGPAAGRPLTIDVSALDFVDLAGLRALACCRTGRAAAYVTVRGVTPFVARVIRLAGLGERLGLEPADTAR